MTNQAELLPDLRYLNIQETKVSLNGLKKMQASYSRQFKALALFIEHHLYDHSIPFGSHKDDYSNSSTQSFLSYGNLLDTIVK
jgi:hypothetical protein